MNYTALALKWRPRYFEDVVGQAHITESLKNAIEKNKIAVAYLFSGPRGIGKTSTARIFAKALNCLQGPTVKPCQVCTNCKEITESRALDVIEIDGASNRRIEEIRALRENVKFPPTRAKFKIYIIDEVHMLTTEAFNALLKTLEEPPEFVKFIFATTQPEKVIPTILSRCQHFRFKRVSSVQMTNYLEKIAKEENIQIDKEVLFAISQASDGSLRDALVLLDQVSTYAKEKVSLKEIYSLLGILDKKAIFGITQKIIQKDIKGLLNLINEIIEEGKSYEDLLSNLIKHFRNLMVIKATNSATELIDLSKEDQMNLFQQAQNFSMEEIFFAFNLLVNTQEMAKRIDSWHLLLEINLLKLAYEKKNLGEKTNSETSVNSEKKAPLQEKKTDKIKENHFKQITYEQEKDSLENNSNKNKENISNTEKFLSLELIKNSWDKIISDLAKIKMHLAQFLSEAELVKLEGNKLILSFPKNFSLNKELLEKKENRQIIEKLLFEQFKIDLRTEFILSNEEKKLDLEKKEEIDESLKSALEAFNARLIN